MTFDDALTKYDIMFYDMSSNLRNVPYRDLLMI
jgi:hypothetical protein